jgi:hypothetical protein
MDHPTFAFQRRVIFIHPNTHGCIEDVRQMLLPTSRLVAGGPYIVEKLGKTKGQPLTQTHVPDWHDRCQVKADNKRVEK